MVTVESGHQLNVIECVPETSDSISIWQKSDIQPTTPTDPNKPILYLHGYAACGILFANSMANVSYTLNRPCYAIDWPSMGCSSKHVKYNPKTPQQALAYMINPIEEFRQKYKIQYFDIIAHSLGAYLASKYSMQLARQALAQPDKPRPVDKLILASPIGMCLEPDWPEDDYHHPNHPSYWKYKYLWGSIFKSRITATGFLSLMGDNKITSYGKNLVHNMVERRFAGQKNMNILGVEKDSNLVANLTHQTFTSPKGSANAIHDLVNMSLFAYLPFENDFVETLDLEQQSLEKLGLKNSKNNSKFVSESDVQLTGTKLPDILVSYGNVDWVGNKEKAITTKFFEKYPDKIKYQDTTGTHHFVITSSQEFDKLILQHLVS